jgi:amidase
MGQLWRLPATEIAQAIRSRSISAREAAQDALERLDAVNPAINAVVECRPEEVLAQADAIDARLSQGEDPGLLAGVPVTTKINVDQAGFPTTNGIRAQQNLVAAVDNPVVASLRQAGAVLLGRTNAPAFSYRWFTNNLLHGATRNPRDPALTPGGSSGGAAAAVVAGIGAIAHGTDIAGSVRFPAYACGVHGLRPSFGRIAAYNASSPERTMGAQLMAVSGPIARTIADLRLALTAMAAPSQLDPWWVPAPLEGAPVTRIAALCIRPDGLEVEPAVAAALQDAARRLERAGWTLEEVSEIPPLAEAADIQVKLWLGDGYPAMVAAAEREGDPGARAALAGQREMASRIDLATFSAALTRRATLVRQWQAFLARYAVLIVPVCGELPFADNLDLADDASYARVWRAQMPQVGLPLIGVPALTVSTGMAGSAPVGVQVVAARFREDLCLLAGEAIEASGTPPAPIDPVGAAQPF